MRRSGSLWVAVPVLVFVLFLGFAAAQEAAPAKGLDVTYVNDDVFAAVVLHPSRVLKSPALKDVPLAAVATAMKEAVGFEPQQVEQVMLLLSFAEAFPPRDSDRAARQREVPWRLEGIQPGLIVRFKEPLATKDLVARVAKAAKVGELEEVTWNDKTYYLAARIDLAAYRANDRTLVIGFEPELKKMLAAASGKGVLAERLRKAGAAHDVIVAVNADAVRKTVERFRREIGRAGDTLPIGLLLELYKHLKGGTFTADIAENLRLQWDLDAASAESAELLNDLARGWFAALKVFIPVLKKGSFEREGLAGLLEPIARAAKVSRHEDRVLVQMDFSKEDPKLVVSLARAVVDARLAARLAQSKSNLRQIGLAMHHFHDTFNAFPSHASYNKDGKPLLSWRVHILPYFELTDLWAEFHHDEPWDSPHNKKLIAKMPPMYKNPNADLPAGKTCYLIPLSSDKKKPSIFLKGATDKNRGGVTNGVPNFILGIPIGEIRDGTANTMMIVEAAPEKAVFWTQPDDWEFDPKKPKEGLFGMWSGFALAAFADASVHTLPERIDAETIRRLIWREDGEPVEIP